MSALQVPETPVHRSSVIVPSVGPPKKEALPSHLPSSHLQYFSMYKTILRPKNEGHLTHGVTG